MQDDREDKAGVQDADNCLCRLKDIVNGIRRIAWCWISFHWKLAGANGS